MYLKPTENHWACDIEADDLLDKATTIWCVCVENILSGQKFTFTDEAAFGDWQAAHPDVIYVGHNFIAYDLPMLNRHWKAGIGVSRVVDTFVLSQVYNPNMKGGHSLGSWGTRLKLPKGDYDDFSRLTDEMVEYCRQDTHITATLFRRLSERMRQVGFSEFGLEIEHLSWDIIQNKQRRRGFPFNRPAAEELLVSIREREADLKEDIYRRWPPTLCVVGEYPRCRKQNGEFTALYNRHSEQYPRVEELSSGGYRIYDYVAFNLGSPKQRIEKLLGLGWKPTRFTKKTEKGGGGNPQIDEEELLAFAEESGISEVGLIAKWMVANSRGNMIRTWLNAYNEKTGAIHGRLFINSTLRYRHSNPNSANIPAVKTKKIKKGSEEIEVVKYGEEGTWAYECRDLFDCGDKEKYSLVGIDAKGIQLRNLAHHAYSREFADEVLTGDPHRRNIEVLGLANKPAAKKFLYTTLMGGAGARLAADQKQFGTSLTTAEGAELKSRLIDSIPGFKGLISSLQDRLRRRGRIVLCDGTPLLVPSDHMVIPYLLQGDESRIMKLASIYLDREIVRLGWSDRAWKVADIHDEWQFVVAVELVEEFIAVALPCFKRAGEFFKYRVPIEGDAKEGKTWAETH